MSSVPPPTETNQNPNEEFIDLGIRRPDQPALMEDYLYNDVYADGPGNDGLSMEELAKNPEYYFNFGFNLSNYKSYLMKQIYMRMEKYVIKESMEKKGPDMKNIR